MGCVSVVRPRTMKAIAAVPHGYGLGSERHEAPCRSPRGLRPGRGRPGSHLLPVRDVERAVYPHLGPGRDIEAVKQASDALEKAYKDAGYGTVFVDIPEQTVEDGIVRLKVTEGTLAHVRVRGERYFSGRQILAELPA